MQRGTASSGTVCWSPWRLSWSSPTMPALSAMAGPSSAQDVPSVSWTVPIRMPYGITPICGGLIPSVVSAVQIWLR
jgi:hypothetical protein